MSRFSPPSIYLCPCCTETFSRSGVASFSDFGCTRWSDGYANIWILEQTTSFGRCPTCKDLIWLDDCQRVKQDTNQAVASQPRPKQKPFSALQRILFRLKGGKHDLFESDLWVQAQTKLSSSASLVAPLLDDYRETLSDPSSLTIERELFLRRHLFWRGNDHQRQGNDGTATCAPKLSHDERVQNLSALDALCTKLNTERDWILHGEVLRLLGRFDEAVAALENVDESEKNTAQKIISFAKQKSIEVQEVWRSEYAY